MTYLIFIGAVLGLNTLMAVRDLLGKMGTISFMLKVWGPFSRIECF